MKAAVVTSFDEAPRYADFREPTPKDGEVLLRVKAAALSNLVKGQASGRHYSSGSELPFVPGNDGVGMLPDGRRVYFIGPPAPFGSMAEFAVVAESQTIELPATLDDVTAAALGNPGLASWGALIGRARIQKGETVLVNGATGVAGQQAIQVARYLGAKHVIATGRDAAALERLKEIGADQTISLLQPEQDLLLAFKRLIHEDGVDIVLDYLWGMSAETFLKAAVGHGSAKGEPRIRFVQIGSMSGGSITLDAQSLRSSGVELLGSGLGSLSAEAIMASLRTMYAATSSTALAIETESFLLSEVGEQWNRAESGRRLVFTI